MTTVSIGVVPGADWTWATATWPWSDAYAGAFWSAAYPGDYTLDVSELLATQGNYLQMDGSGYLMYPTDFPAGTYTQMTFEGWFRSSASQTGNPGLLGVNSPGNFIQITNDANNRLRVTVASTTVAYLAITVGAWHHVAVVYDAAAADGFPFKTYLNGVLAASATTLASYTFSAGAKVYLGRGNPTVYLGAMRDLRIWNYARSAQEIADWRYKTANSLDPRLLFHVPVTQNDHQNEKQAATANLFEYTESIVSPWGAIRTVVTANAATDPLGGNTAIKLAVDTTPTTSHYLRNGTALSLGLHTKQVCVKAAEFRYVWMTFDGGFVGGSQFYLFFDLLIGVFLNTPLDSRIPYYTATDIGDGWWLLTMTGNIAFAVTDFNYIGVANAPLTTVTTVADGTSGIYIWHPQLEVGMPTPYAANLTATSGASPRTADRPAIGTNTFGLDGSNIDAVTKIINKPLAETMAFTEAAWRGPEINNNEALNIAEVYSDLFNAILNIAEAINFADVCKKDVAIIKAEAMAMAEAISKEPGKNVGEVMAIAEGHSDIATFIRIIAETCNFAEVVRKHPTKTVGEFLLAVDYIFRRGEGVISDLSFENAFLTYESFMARFSDPVPAGYNAWVPFLPGDYEYREAVVETKLIREHITQDTKLTRSEIRADMPDLMESGEYTVTLTAGTETVPLTKPFSVVRDVQITGVSGATSTTPRVPSYTKTGFSIELRDSANVRQTGVIRYTVRGY